MTTWIIEIPDSHVDFIATVMEGIVLDGNLADGLMARIIKDNLLKQTSMEYMEIKK